MPDFGQDIGQNYLMVDGVAWKAERYACCGWAHAGVEGARQLVLENKIQIDDIAKIRVEGGHGTMRLGARLPSTTEEAQFNQAWPLAAMLVDGEIGPAQMLEARLADPEIRALAQKVEVHESAEMQALCHLYEIGDPRGRFASQVTITLNDGRTLFSGLVDGGLRFPPVGWDEDRMSDKFRWLAEYVLSAGQVEPTLEQLWRFDQLASVRTLAGALAEPEW
jgi:2-methylcitrate dehydratase PrpD